MRHGTRVFGLTVAALAAAVVLVGDGVAEAGKRKPPRNRGRRALLTAKAPNKGRTPEQSQDGGSAGAPRDVAGAPLQGDGRKDALQGGTALVLSPTRALVANPYRGLAVVDVSDPDAPAIVGSVALDGSADRVFVERDDAGAAVAALVVSQAYDEAGGSTRVTAVDLTDEAHPAVRGDVKVAGSLASATQSGADLIVVTSEYVWGPIFVDLPKVVDNTGKTRDDAAPGVWTGWGRGRARVARITRDDAGAPVLVGTPAEFDGSLVAHDVDGDDVALAVDDTSPWMTFDGAGDEFRATGLQLVDVDASGAPEVDGFALLGMYGVQALDLAGDVARVVGWTYESATRLSTWRCGDDGAPTQLAFVDLAEWPSAATFSGDRYAYLTQTWSYGEPGPYEPADGAGPRGKPSVPGVDVGSTKLHVVDVSDPEHPGVAVPVDLGVPYAGSITAVPGGVVATGSGDGSTSVLVRADLSDPAVPDVGDPVELDGFAYGLQVLDDLLLVNGGGVTASGAYVPTLRPVSLADGGLAVGGALETNAWGATPAWSSPILGLASVDALSLVDLSDFANPAARGTVRLAVNVTDLAVLSDAAAACLVTDYVGGAIEVRTVSLPAADALVPLDTVTVGTGDARLFRDGSTLYVLGTDWSTGRGFLRVVDASDPTDVRARGSLDLASYPGQAFLVNGAMVLLREAWSLVETNERGRKVPMADAFGRCPVGWTYDELSAVVDVIDLSDPDAPRAAVRRRVRWDFGGEAILMGSMLYVPSYTSFGDGVHGYEQVIYGVRGIDLADPLKPRVSRLVEVPGSLVAAVDGDGKVLTVSYSYDDATYDVDAEVHLVDLRARDKVVATRDVAGAPSSVVVGDAHAYVATETWSETGSVYGLETLGLADLALATSTERDRSAWSGRVAGGHLFLRSWGFTGSIDVFSLADPAAPAFATRADVDGVGTSIGVAGGRAYVPAGYRGVHGFDLGD